MWAEESPEHYGSCDCDRAECEVARAVRAASAAKVVEATAVEYGEATSPDTAFPLSSFPAREWACRAFPWRSDRECPGCHYKPRRAPPWAEHRAVFALRGTTYKIVAVGSTNRYSPNGLHSEDTVTCEEIGTEPWAFPALPATGVEVGRALHVLFKGLPRFRAHELDGAMRAVG